MIVYGQYKTKGVFQMKVNVNKIEESNKYKITEAESVEFINMEDFYEYLCIMPFNDSFRWVDHHSVTQTKVFTGTNSFDEAVELMKNGWTDMAKTLTNKIKVETKATPMMKSKTTYGVAGYQAIVPLYLNGVPTNMASKKNVSTKQKVVTITKCIQYNCETKQEKIIEESTKVFKIIKKLEAQGYRCILNVTEMIEKYGKAYQFKVRVKNATEKMNLSKLAFPMIHPSMLRRLMFRMLEVHPYVPKQFTSGYGHPMTDTNSIMKVFAPEKDEYILPSILPNGFDVEKINTLEDLAMFGK